ncbi:hypothetical protein LPB41_13760 [Thalassospira sp. MA62]|nr:hypothetical protein [Thalassospira sp. MA62]
MSDDVMRNSYTVVCVRATGNSVNLKTVSDYSEALHAAKQAIALKTNTEVHIVQQKFDPRTYRDKQQVVKILTKENAGMSGPFPGVPGGNKPPVSREVANKASQSFIYLVIAITVIILLGGIMVPLAMR